MSAGAKKVAEPIASVIITKFDDPVTPLKYSFNGTWKHKEILSIITHLAKEFRRYMTQQRHDEVSQPSEDKE